MQLAFNMTYTLCRSGVYYVTCIKVTCACNMLVRCAFPIRLGYTWEYCNNKQMHTYCMFNSAYYGMPYMCLLFNPTVRKHQYYYSYNYTPQ